MQKLIAQLITHEGLRLKPYRDTVGKTTIAVGRNLDDVGISEDEAMLLLGNDIYRAIHDLEIRLEWFYQMDDARQAVLIDMCFNMGWPRLSQFKKTLAYCEAGNWSAAAAEMLNSTWAKQVGNRAKTLSLMMESGQWPTGKA